METLLQPESVGAEARSVSEILAKSNPAGIPAMRTSLSFLTSAGAELATALEKREQELAELRAIIAALPPEWVEAAKAGTSMPDIGALRAELQLAIDERDDLQALLVERNAQAQALQDQIAEMEASPAADAEAELEQLKARDVQVQADLNDRTAELESLNARVAELQASLDQMSIARAGVENDLRDRDAELADIENQLAAMTSELSQVQPPGVVTEVAPEAVAEAAPEAIAEAAPEAIAEAVPEVISEAAPEAVAEAAPEVISEAVPEAVSEAAPEAVSVTAAEVQDPRQRRAIRLGALAAAVSAAVDRSKKQSSELQIAMSEVAALNEQITTLTSDRVALQASVDEQEQSLTEEEEEIDGLRSDIENLNGQVTELTARVDELQTDLDATLAAKAQAEEQLQASESALAELQQQVDGAQEQLRALLPEDVLAQLTAEQSDEQAPAEGEPAEAIAPAEGEPAEAIAPVEGEPAEAIAPADGEQAQEPSRSKVLGLAALTTGVAAVVEQGKKKSAELDETAAQIAALNHQIEALAGDKMAMEADLEDKDRALEDLNIQIESLNEQLASPPAPTEALSDPEAQIQALNAQVADLQSQLAAANAAKADLEQQLIATQGQLDDLTAQVDSFKEQLQSILSPEDLAALQVGEREPVVEGEETALTEGVEGEEIVPTEGVEGEEVAPTEGVEAESKEGVGTLGLAALAGGVAAAINRSKSQTADLDSQLATLQEQLAALNSDKAGLETSLQEKELSLASFNENLLSQQGQVNELAAERSTTEAMLQAKEQELAEAQTKLQAMQATIDDMTAQLQGVNAQVSELESQVEAVAPFEQAVDLGERLARLPAIKQTAASAAFVLGKQPVLTPKVQALTSVAGIGSVRQQKLYNAGVGTFWELSNLDNAQLESLFSLSASRLQRVDFDETRASARQLADETDTVGLLWDGERVDDMEPITGIGRVFEQRLYEAGLTTYESIASSTPERLAEIIHAPEFNQPDYGAWINEAKLLVEIQQQDEAARFRAPEPLESPDSEAQG